MPDSASRAWTRVGLAIALFGLPLIVGGYHVFAPERSAAATVVRELLILGLTAALLWIVITKEKLPLSSIGLRRDAVGRSLAWAIGLTTLIFGALIALLAAFSAVGIRYGEGEAATISLSIWVTLLTVTRAGLAEEIFYRGFAIERIEALTGSKWIAAILPLLFFAGFHFRQGVPGMVLALVLGAIFTVFYLWKRNLLAVIAAHFLVDLIPNVLLPLLGASEGA